MARASAWGHGNALAYRGLDIDAQAELLALYAAHRSQERDEAIGVLKGALVELVNDIVSAAKTQGELPEKPVQLGSQPAPRAVGAAKTQAGGVRPAPLPDILTPRLSAADLLK